MSTVTISVKTGGKTVEVEGRLVAPGLAVTPSLSEQADRWSLTHVDSGKAFIWERCQEHIDTAVQMVLKADVDWTAQASDLPINDVIQPLHKKVSDAIGRHCRTCGPRAEGPTWEVRCNTCDWQWEDEYNDGPLTARDAKNIARDHECEPDIQITGPGVDGWYREWQVKDDGTLRTSERAS